jgi:hypothetical protein
MPYKRIVTETRISNASQWYVGSAEWKTYRKATYRDTGKLTMSRSYYDGSNQSCEYDSPQHMKRQTVFLFDTKESHDEYMNDANRIELSGNIKTVSDTNNNITKVIDEVGYI